MPEHRPLRVFLCHASQDKSKVRELYDQLKAEGWIDPWLDIEKLFPGQNWRTAIREAIGKADNIIICLSNSSVTRKGYIQKEMRYAQEICLDKSEGIIFLIPLRLEECEVPGGLQFFQWIDYFGTQKEQSYKILLKSLQIQFEEKKRGGADENAYLESTERPRPEAEETRHRDKKVDEQREPTRRERDPVRIQSEEPLQAPSDEKTSQPITESLDLQVVEAVQDIHKIWGNIEFVKVSKGEFIMGSHDKNSLAFDDEKPRHHVVIPYDFWIGRFLVTKEQFSQFIVSARYSKKRSASWKYAATHPVINALWKDVQFYLRWLNANYGGQLFGGVIYRLPTEAEWEKAARGVNGREWPWGNKFDRSLCNSSESDICTTTQVGTYSPLGDSPYGCADMSGNIWQWTQSLYRPYPYNPNDGREVLRGSGFRVVRGGSFYRDKRLIRCAYRKSVSISKFAAGFRVVVAPPTKQ